MNNTNRIYLSPPEATEHEADQVIKALNGGFICPGGDYNSKFEEKIRRLTGSPYCLSTISGTAAIHLALLSAGVKPGDLVFCSALTFAAAVFPIIYCGAEPVFIDSDMSTWNMSPDLLEEAIQQEKGRGKSCKAVLFVDIYGKTSGIEKVLAVAEKHNLVLIEDAAEAVGSEYKDKYAGTFGELGIYSFNGNKIITTSQGGALLSKKAELDSRARFISGQSSAEKGRYFHPETGYNYRMSNILAAIGNAQIDRLDEQINKRKQIQQWYRESLSKEKITFLKESENEVWNHWLTCLLFEDKTKAGKIQSTLEQNNIESRRLMYPMHMQPFGKTYASYINGTSEHLYSHGLAVPSGSNLKKTQVEQISSIIRSCL